MRNTTIDNLSLSVLSNIEIAILVDQEVIIQHTNNIRILAPKMYNTKFHDYIILNLTKINDSVSH